MTATDANYWNLARDILTPRQFQILELRRRHNMPLRAMTYHLDLSLATIRDTVTRAEQKLEIETRRRYFDENPAA